MMSEVALAEWNRFLDDHPDAHILQTGEWGELKAGFGWKPVRLISGAAGAQVLFRKLPLGFSIAYLPKGPVFHDAKLFPGRDFWERLDSVCKKHHSIFCKVEFDSWDGESLTGGENSSSVISPYNIQPPRTIIINISGTEEEILARMKQKTRYNIRLAEKKGVSVRAWDDIQAFHGMMLVTGGRDNFGVHSLAYYRRAYELFHPAGMAELLVAEFEGKPIAALMVFARGKRAWYIYGASTDEERNRMPTYLLQWEAINWARKKGAQEYDLWGVPDEGEDTLEAEFEKRHDGLWGVYRFKRGYGGELKRATQAVDRIYLPFLYKLYLRRMAGREGG